jgi:hypothetical protein
MAFWKEDQERENLAMQEYNREQNLASKLSEEITARKRTNKRTFTKILNDYKNGKITLDTALERLG